MQKDNKNKKSKFSGDAFSIVMSILCEFILGIDYMFYSSYKYYYCVI